LIKTQAIDAGLRWVANIKQLKWIDLGDTKITDGGAAELGMALPECRIYSNPKK